MPVTPPAGFSPFGETSGYINLNGPYFWSKNPEGAFEYRFLSDARHTNTNGVLHGASLIAFVDTFLGHSIFATTGKKCATISLSSQFVAARKTGTWVEGRAHMRTLTRTLAFLDADVSTEGTLLLTATAIFKIFEDRQAL